MMHLTNNTLYLISDTADRQLGKYRSRFCGIFIAASTKPAAE